MSNGSYPNPQKPGQAPQMKPSRFNVVGLIVSVMIFGMLLYLFSAGLRQPQAKQISYTEFKQQVGQAKVEQITMKGKHVSGVYKQTKKKSAAKKNSSPLGFQTYLPAINDPSLMPLLEKKAVTINVSPPTSSIWSELLIGLLPWVLPIGVFIYQVAEKRVAAALCRHTPIEKAEVMAT